MIVIILFVFLPSPRIQQQYALYVKGHACSDKPTDIYHQLCMSSSALRRISACFSSLFWWRGTQTLNISALLATVFFLA